MARALDLHELAKLTKWVAERKSAETPRKCPTGDIPLQLGERFAESMIAKIGLRLSRRSYAGTSISSGGNGIEGMPKGLDTLPRRKIPSDRSSTTGGSASTVRCLVTPKEWKERLRDCTGL